MAIKHATYRMNCLVHYCKASLTNRLQTTVLADGNTLRFMVLPVRRGGSRRCRRHDDGEVASSNKDLASERLPREESEDWTICRRRVHHSLEARICSERWTSQTRLGVIDRRA